jgi:anti-sigma regulatory factor (Ser/Thr protein kinase)
MVALSEAVTSAAAEMRWIGVEEASAASSCRSAAVALAARAGLPRARSDQLALAVTEAASNLHRHARDGSLMLRPGDGRGGQGIELVTIDSGPGVADVDAAMRDGHSTAGTLGIGLGAIRRLADSCELYSAPGHGTSLVARFLAASSGTGSYPQPRYAGLIRPITGEAECGDGFAAFVSDGTVTGVLCDGLGHGPLAAEATREAIAAVLADPQGEPAALLERVHRRLGHTRGGAVAIVQLSGQHARFAGLGNVAGWILHAGRRDAMLSVPGIGGHRARTIRQFEYPVAAGAAVVLHSDGLTSRWDAGALPGLEARDPLVIAATLLATAGIHRDDAGILVLTP